MTTIPTPRKKKIRLGELLLRENVITELQLQEALQRQKQSGKTHVAVHCVADHHRYRQ